MRARSNVPDTRDQDVATGCVAAHKPDPLTALPRGNIVRLHASAHQGTIVEKTRLIRLKSGHGFAATLLQK